MNAFDRRAVRMTRRRRERYIVPYGLCVCVCRGNVSGDGASIIADPRRHVGVEEKPLPPLFLGRSLRASDTAAGGQRQFLSPIFPDCRMRHLIDAEKNPPGHSLRGGRRAIPNHGQMPSICPALRPVVLVKSSQCFACTSPLKQPATICCFGPTALGERHLLAGRGTRRAGAVSHAQRCARLDSHGELNGRYALVFSLVRALS